MNVKILLTVFILISSASFAQVNLNNGLMLYLPFNGNAIDVSGNNNNGVVNGATLNTGQAGLANTAYLFNGTSNFIQIPNSATLNFPGNTFSIYTLVKPMGFYAGTCHGNSIVDKGNGDFIQGWYCLRFGDGMANPIACSSPVNVAVENFFVMQYNMTNPVNYTPYINTNTWYCVIAIYDGTNVKCYKDGILVGTWATSGSIGVNNHDLFLGRKNSGAFPYWFNGVMDEVRIYNRALNTDEIDSLCNLTSPLPVSLTGFNGMKLESADRLSWTTASEQNNAYFSLQHSTDGVSFQTIAKLNSKAVNGNSSVPLYYTHTNPVPAAGKNYYRLLQSDIDQNITILPEIITLIRPANGTTIHIYPNPVKDILTIDLYASDAYNMNFKLLDMSGRAIKQLSAKSSLGMNNLTMNIGNTPGGVYIMQIYKNGSLMQTSKVTKVE